MNVRKFTRSQSVRIALACLLPLPAVALQWIFWAHLKPSIWFLVYPVMFFAALVGGLWGGIGATLIAAALIWYLFLPPELSFTVVKAGSLVSTSIFVASGITFSILLDRLRRRDELFRTLFTLASDGVVYSDAAGRYLEVNPRYCQMLGRSRREIVGARLSEMTVDVTPEFYGGTGAQLASSGRATAETQLRHKDGRLTPVEVTVASLGGGQRVAIVRDVSERKRADQQLRQSEEKYAKLFHSSPVGMAIGRLDDGLFVAVNKAYTLLVGYTEDELVGHHSVELGILSQSTRSMLVERLEQEGRLENFEIEVKCKCGETKTCLYSAEILDLPEGPHLQHSVVDITPRKQVESALHASEERLRYALDVANEGLWDWNIATGEVVANDQWFVLFGYAPGEAPATIKLWKETLHPDDAAGAGRALNDYLEGRTHAYTSEHRVVTKSGRIRWHLSAGKVVARDPAGRPVRMVGTNTDITERKRAEVALRASEERLRAVIDSSPDVVWIWNEDGTLKYVSDALQSHYGTAPEILLRATAAEHTLAAQVPAGELTAERLVELGSADLAAVRDWLEGQRIVQACVRDLGATLEQESHVRTVDGRELDLHTTYKGFRHGSSVVEVVAITHDVTPIVAAKEQAQRALQQLKLATDAAEMGIWKWNFADDSLDWDDRLCEFYGVSAAERTQGLFYDVWRLRLHPDDRARSEAELMEARAAGTELTTTFRIVLPDGRTRYIYSACVAERDHSGKPLRMIGINRDVTRERIYEQYLEDANVVLEQRVAERTAQLQETAAALARANAGKDAFLAAMSHELRTPLTGILSAGEILEAQTRGTLTEQQLRYVNLILTSGQRLLDLVNGVLLYASLMAGKMPVRSAPCRLADVAAASMRSLLDKSVRKGQSIVVDVQPENLAITSDGELMTRMLVLLLDNAVKFTNPNGTVGILARRLSHHDAVRLVVWDTGIGIEPEKLPYLFDPFTQVDQTLARRYEGIGVGLATVRKMVELLGGSISVESEPGKGSRFMVTLPAELSP